jgi:hypothetical protein
MSVMLANPLLIQEGWLRHQEKDAKPPLIEAARYRACASRAAQTGWLGLTQCFRMAFFKRGSILDHY